MVRVNIGTLTQPVIWSCLEISFGLISACIPSLMPLLLILTGKRMLDSGQKVGQYDNRGREQLKSSRFSRMKDQDGILLDEHQQLSSSTPNTIDDGACLESNTKPSRILITNKIVQSHEMVDPLSLRKEESAIIPSSWTSRSPPAAED
jgi:hypothetical protein